MIKLRDLLNEAQMHAQTQREALWAIKQLKVNLAKEPDLMRLLIILENKIKKYEPR